MKNEQLPLDTPEAPRFPMRGIPLAEMLQAIHKEGGYVHYEY